LCEGGVYGATIDPIVITSWWTRWPLALIGVPQGRRTGTWALDVDAKEAHSGDGLGAWEKLEREHSPYETRIHITGTGGLHRIHRWNDDRPIGCPVKSVPQGMEVKGEGGYIIFPPSPYVREGQTVRYRVSTDCDPAEAPAWLYDLVLGPRPRAAKSNTSAAGGTGTFTWSEKFGQKKLDEICDLLRTAEQHHWDEATRKLWVFGRWVGGGAYDKDEALEKGLGSSKREHHCAA